VAGVKELRIKTNMNVAHTIYACMKSSEKKIVCTQITNQMRMIPTDYEIIAIHKWCPKVVHPILLSASFYPFEVKIISLEG
jgi:hypothetical protein